MNHNSSTGERKALKGFLRRVMEDDCVVALKAINNAPASDRDLLIDLTVEAAREEEDEQVLIWMRELRGQADDQ